MAALTFVTAMVFLAVGGNALTFQEKYDIWSQDLKPGFIIEQSIMDGSRCYCKVPKPTTFISTTSTTTTTAPTTTPPNSTITTSTPPTTTTPTTTSTSTPTTTSTSTITTPTTTSTSTTTTPTTTSTSTTTTPTTTSTSTTTTPTTTSTSTTSTSTTTPTTTSTTTPTTTSTSTATTTTTTTTTIPPSTTPAPTSTTTTTVKPVSVDCGSDCNLDIHANKDNFNVGSNYVYWTSPNYPGQYLDGCDCTLNFYLESHGFVSISFEEGSAIYGINNCSYDKLTLDGNLNNNGVYCDEHMESIEANMFKTTPEDPFFTAVFTSDPNDKNTVAAGFKIKIYIELWAWRRNLKDEEEMMTKMEMEREMKNKKMKNKEMKNKEIIGKEMKEE